MQVLIGLAPFILFAALTQISVTLGLWLALATAFTLGMRTFLQRRELRSLDLGNVIVFSAVALFAGFIQPGISIQPVRFLVNGGLLCVILFSLFTRSPFTLPFAREITPREDWAKPGFMRLNMRISTIWALVFAVMTAGDLASFLGWLPLQADIALGVACLIGGGIYTYRQSLRRKPAPPVL